MSSTILAALAAYDAATARPGAADWRSVAEMLRACVKLPKPRTKSVPAGGWAHYPAGPKATFSTLAITFADGRTITATAATNPGKPVNVGQAVLAAVAFYRRRIYGALGYVQPCQFSVTLAPWDAAIAVPAITDVRCETDDSVFDAEACTAATVDARAGVFVLADAEREAQRFYPIDRIGMVESAYVRAWQGAFLQAELDSRAAHNARRAAHDALVIEVRDKAAGEAMAVWCEAVGMAYADPAPWEVTGTVDAPEGLDGTGPAPDAPEVDPVPPAPAPAAPARKRAPRKVRGSGESGGGTPAVGIADATPAVGIPTPPPVEAIADPVEAIDFEPIPSTFGEDEPVTMPDDETHPVIVHCHSSRARAAVFARILDGTFPSDGVQAKAGSFRLTYADAVACEGLPSVRFTGMPRKAYTRRPAPLPKKTTVRSVPFCIPVGAFTPAGAMAGMPATLHAPSI